MIKRYWKRQTKFRNKPRNGVNSYYNISNDSQRTKPPLAPNSLDTPRLNKCPNKELEVTIINDTENTTHKLNVKIQDITTEPETIKKYLTEIDNQFEPKRNKEFIEILQPKNTNLVKENKSKTTIIQMLFEN